MSRPTFKPARPGETPDNAAIRALAQAAAGGTRFDRPAPGPAASDAAPAREPAEPTRKATFDLPATLHRELQRAAMEQGVTMRHLILRALADAGYAVSEAALVPDRRSERGKRRG